MADVARLIHVLHRLVDAGKHGTGDRARSGRDGRSRLWLIDMVGSEGGTDGGEAVFEGPMKQILKAKTHTGAALKNFLSRHGK